MERKQTVQRKSQSALPWQCTRAPTSDTPLSPNQATSIAHHDLATNAWTAKSLMLPASFHAPAFSKSFARRSLLCVDITVNVSEIERKGPRSTPSTTGNSTLMTPAPVPNRGQPHQVPIAFTLSNPRLKSSTSQ